MTNKKNVETLDVNERIAKSEALVNKYKKPFALGILALIVVVVAVILYNVMYATQDFATPTSASGRTHRSTWKTTLQTMTCW